jgi:hypothetical protein
MRDVFKTSALYSMLFLSSLVISACSPNPSDLLNAYQEAHNSHDIEKVLSLMTDDIKFQLVGTWVREGKEQIQWIEEWDAAVNGHLTFTDVKAKGKTVTCKVIERNDLFKLYGIEEVSYKSATFIFRDRLIEEIRVEPSQKSVKAINEMRQSFVEWASQERSQQLEALRPEGEFVYSAQNAGVWLALLEEWRENAKP